MKRFIALLVAATVCTSVPTLAANNLQQHYAGMLILDRELLTEVDVDYSNGRGGFSSNSGFLYNSRTYVPINMLRNIGYNDGSTARISFDKSNNIVCCIDIKFTDTISLSYISDAGLKKQGKKWYMFADNDMSNLTETTLLYEDGYFYIPIGDFRDRGIEVLWDKNTNKTTITGNAAWIKDEEPTSETTSEVTTETTTEAESLPVSEIFESDFYGVHYNALNSDGDELYNTVERIVNSGTRDYIGFSDSVTEFMSEEDVTYITEQLKYFLDMYKEDKSTFCLKVHSLQIAMSDQYGVMDNLPVMEKDSKGTYKVLNGELTDSQKAELEKFYTIAETEGLSLKDAYREYSDWFSRVSENHIFE